MLQPILKQAIEYVSNDHKLIRLSFITSFCHSLIAMYLLALYTGGILEAKFEKGFTMRDSMEYILQRIGTSQEIGILIGVIIFVIIGYALIYPIGQASVIHYLHDQKQSISRALGKGTTKFFPMFEFNAFSTSFGMMSFILILLRIIAMDIVGNILAQILLIIFFICVFTASVLRPYTKYYIVLEEEGVYDAIKRSISTSIKHIGTTIKCALLEMILLIRGGVVILPPNPPIPPSPPPLPFPSDGFNI